MAFWERKNGTKTEALSWDTNTCSEAEAHPGLLHPRGQLWGLLSASPLTSFRLTCGSWSNVRRNGDTGERSLEHECAHSRVHADTAAPWDGARGGPGTRGVQELRRRGRLDPVSSEGRGLSQQDVIRGELPELCSCLSSLKANRLHLWCSWHWPWLPGRAFPTLRPGDGRLRTPASSSPSPSLLFLILLLRGIARVFFGRFPFREYCVPQGCFLKTSSLSVINADDRHGIIRESGARSRKTLIPEIHLDKRKGAWQLCTISGCAMPSPHPQQTF